MEAIRYQRDINPESSRGWMSAAFQFVTSREARAKALEKVHEREKRRLKRDQKQATDRALAEERRHRKGSLARALDMFGTERAALIARQDSEKADMKARWCEQYESQARGIGTILQAASYRKAAKADTDPRDRAEAHDRAQQFRDAVQGRKRKIGCMRRRIRGQE